MQKVRTPSGEEQVAKGMVLAAGQGTRGRPLMRDLSKPMVSILGKSVMADLMAQSDIGITAALAEHKAKSAIARVVALDVPLSNFEVYGVVLAAPNEKILSFQEKPKPPQVESALASTGIYIFASTALNPIPPGVIYAFEYTRTAADIRFSAMNISPEYCVDHYGDTLYRGDDTSQLRWGAAQA